MVRRGRSGTRSAGPVLRSNPLGISPMRAAKLALKLAAKAKNAYDGYKSKSRSKSFKSAKSTSSYAINDAFNERGGSSAGKVTVYKRKGAKGVKNRKPKGVAVSKQFKLKVAKVLSKKDIHGRWEQISYSSMKCSDFGSTNTQCVYIPGIQAGNDSGTFFTKDAWGACGNLSDYIHILSVLWNGKTDSQGARAVNDVATLGQFTAQNPSILLNQYPGQNPVDAKFTVKSHTESYRLRNNSKRTWTIDIYLCRPKKETSELSQMIASSVVQTLPYENPLVGNPLMCWATGIQEEYNSAHFAINDVTPFSLFQKPTSIPYFNKCYKTQCTTIVLEPGQVYDYFIQGPSNMNVDVFKAWHAGYFRDVQKYTVYPMFVCRLDMVGDIAGVSRYPTRGQSASVGSILVERRYIVKLTMPEIVLGPEADPTVGLGSTMHQALARRYRSAYKIYDESVETPVKIEEEVPNFEELA